MINAAKAAGVRRIVYTSLLHADTSPLSLAAEHRETEADIKASGVAHTILHNGWYAENYTGSIPGALAGGAFIGSAGEGRMSAASRANFAEAAVAVLTGDDAWTLAELAAEISNQTGRTIHYQDLSAAEYASALAGFGLPDPLAQAIARWDLYAANGALFHEGGTLSRLTGRPTTPMATLVAEALK